MMMGGGDPHTGQKSVPAHFGNHVRLHHATVRTGMLVDIVFNRLNRGSFSIRRSGGFCAPGARDLAFHQIEILCPAPQTGVLLLTTDSQVRRVSRRHQNCRCGRCDSGDNLTGKQH